MAKKELVPQPEATVNQGVRVSSMDPAALVEATRPTEFVMVNSPSFLRQPTLTLEAQNHPQNPADTQYVRESAHQLVQFIQHLAQITAQRTLAAMQPQAHQGGEEGLDATTVSSAEGQGGGAFPSHEPVEEEGSSQGNIRTAASTSFPPEASAFDETGSLRGVVGGSKEIVDEE